jgi:hypothetical protein
MGQLMGISGQPDTWSGTYFVSCTATYSLLLYFTSLVESWYLIWVLLHHVLNIVFKFEFLSISFVKNSNTLSGYLFCIMYWIVDTCCLPFVRNFLRIFLAISFWPGASANPGYAVALCQAPSEDAEHVVVGCPSWSASGHRSAPTPDSVRTWAGSSSLPRFTLARQPPYVCSASGIFGSTETASSFVRQRSLSPFSTRVAGWMICSGGCACRRMPVDVDAWLSLLRPGRDMQPP